MYCLKCQGPTIKNGHCQKSDRPLYLCKECGYRFRSQPPKTLTKREVVVWDAWSAYGERIKPTSRALRTPNTIPCIPTAKPEYIRQVIARVKRKLKEGYKLP